LPLYVGLFISLFLDKPTISGVSFKMCIQITQDQAFSAAQVPFSVLNRIFFVEVEANKKMSDSETPRQVEYGYEDGPKNKSKTS
jgi:hypothetical protein